MERIKKFFRNIDLRKFLGTIVGGIFFLCCVAYFTYAYYEWKSDEVGVALTIFESDVACTLGPNVDVSNIGPVLKLSDGVKSSFGIDNSFTDDMAISVVLDITSISDSLLTESFKWAIVQEQEDGSNFDYENPIIEGSFKNFREGSNLITTALQVPSQKTVNYEFVVYIDGNMKNDISMMQNSMEASLTLGNCGTDYIRYDELTQFAFYSADDNSLTFTYDYPRQVGSTYLGKTVTKIYTGYDTTNYNYASVVPWYSDGNYDDIVSVTFLETTSPISTAFWFNEFKNVTSMNLEKLDTSHVTKMSDMFGGCNSLKNLNVDNFNTNNVTDMQSMFSNCIRLLKLDLSSFNTSNVTKMTNMFYACKSLIELDLSNFNTNNVTLMTSMFYACRSLIELDLSNFDTSNVTSMNHSNGFYGMFGYCQQLTSLDLSNFNTSKITMMGSMFYGCSSLINLNLSNFNTSNVTYTGYMFSGCSSLTNLDLSSFNTNNVKNMVEMFAKCSSLTELDLSNFDTSKVTNMGYMFLNCYKLTTTITIMNTGTTSYYLMLDGAATAKDSDGNYIGCITINYIPDNPNTTDINESTESLVEAMIATKPTNSGCIINGGCKGDYCTIEETATETDDII